MINLGEHYELFDHKKYKYKTTSEILAYTRILGRDIKTEYFHLKRDGTVIIFIGYAWDGCTGVPDLKTTMLASLVHDIGYQCLREGLLLDWSMYNSDLHLYYSDFQKYLKRIDQLFEWLMHQDGAWWITRKVYYRGVRYFGEKHAMPEILKNAT